MPVRINEVTITPKLTTIGQPVTITVVAEDIIWNNLKSEFTNWNEVKENFTNWDKVKNYIYTKPSVDTDIIYTSDGLALFDSNDVQISTIGGATIRYTSDEVDSFLKEVIDS